MKEVGISCQLWGEKQAQRVAEPQATVGVGRFSQQRRGGRLLDLGGPHVKKIPLGALGKNKPQAFPGYYRGFGRE